MHHIVFAWPDIVRSGVLSYYSDLTLTQAFPPMAAQLSKKAAHALAKILATASCRSSKTGYHVPRIYERKLPGRIVLISGKYQVMLGQSGN